MRASFPSPPPMSLSSFSPAPLDGGLRQRTAPAAAAANGSAHTSTNGSAAPNGHGTPARGADKPATRAPAAAAAAAAERIDWEIPRKTLHASIGFFSVWLWARDGSPRRVLVALSGALAVIVPADVLRLRYRPFARVYERVLGFLMRDSEKTSSNGVIWYLLGAIYVLALFPLDIALVSVLILSWADTAASTFGRLWGRRTPPLPRRLLGLPLAPRKSLAGFAAAALTGAAAAAGFWMLAAPLRPQDASWSWDGGFLLGREDAVGRAVRDAGVGGVKAGGWAGLALIAAVAGAVSGVAEALDVGSLDDNLTLPVIAGTSLWAVFKLMSYIA